LFLIPAMSLAGVPPLSGFWAKFVLIQATVQDGAFIIAAIALMVGLLTLYSMVKIWNEAFWKAPPDAARSAGVIGHRIPVSRRWGTLLPMVSLAAITLSIGFFPEPFLGYSVRAAEQLLNPNAYTNAVLGDTTFTALPEIEERMR
jgi:multicomponent Na+:H+ antiporter subunit D